VRSTTRASWQDDKAFLVIAAEHGLQAKATMQDHPFEQMTAIGSIDPDAAQFFPSASQTPQQQLGSGRIGEGRRGDDDGQQQSKGVDQNMPFASFHLLPGVLAAHPRPLRRFDALTIQRSGGGVLMATRTLTNLGPQGLVNPVPRAVIPKRAKIRLHALPGGILSWQHPPLASTHDTIQDRIDNRSHL
jgi:hypothetical protein